jgi:hypothetical protein
MPFTTGTITFRKVAADRAGPGKQTGRPWLRMPEDFQSLAKSGGVYGKCRYYSIEKRKIPGGFDSFGDREIGYSISEDGLDWSKESRIKVQFENQAWAKEGNHSLRTPLCAIEEEDGTITVIYTALMDHREEAFYAVGKCTLAWE